MQTGAGWQLTADAIKHSLVLHALLDVAQNLLKISNCLAGVCAQGVSRLAALSEGATGSVLVFWSQDNESDYKYLIIEGVQSVNIEVLLGDRGDWKNIFVVQFCLYDSAIVMQAVRE